MLTVGDRFPDFALSAVPAGPLDGFATIRNEDFEGRWLVVFTWPKDFTFVCPTEIKAFSDLVPAFRERGADVLGVSLDSEYVHLAWRRQHPDLADLSLAMASDIKRELCGTLGILHAEEGVALRATFLVDPEGTIRYVQVNDLDVGRDPADVLRVLEAFQTGDLTPCAWRPGSETLGRP